MLFRSGTRGWSAERIGEAVQSLERRGWVSGGKLTSTGTAARIQLENDTDRSQDALVAGLGAHLETLVQGGAALTATLLRVERFPYDPRKLAAG